MERGYLGLVLRPAKIEGPANQEGGAVYERSGRVQIDAEKIWHNVPGTMQVVTII